MTVTDTRPETANDAADPAPSAAPQAELSGLAAVVGSGDHKVVGRLYIGFALLFGLLAVAGGLVSAIDRIDGVLGDTLVDADSWYQVLTFQAEATVFLFLLPLLLGVAMVVVPLQVGSRSIAFPRAAAASFWGWLLGSGCYIAAYAINGGPGGGDEQGVNLWAASYTMVLVALLLGAVCVVTTVFAYRAPGMSLDRTPFFAWSMLVGGVVWILTLPVLIATLVLVYVDHRYGQQSFGFNGPEMFDRTSWALRQPQVYAFATPLLGLVADVIPVAAGRRQAQRNVVMGAIAAFAMFGFGAFLQGTIYPNATVEPVYVAMAFLAILPVLALLGGWVGTIKGGKPRAINPLVFAVTAVLGLLLAVLLGAVSSIERFELQGTLFDLGQANLVIFTTVVAATGAVFYWATKIVGRTLAPGLGMLTAVVLFLGALLASVPYAASGAFADGDEVRTGIEALNAAGAAGYALVLAGIVLTILAVVSSRRVEGLPADPWEGHTLEWATASPTTADNFETVRTVASAEPLLDDAAPEEGSA